MKYIAQIQQEFAKIAILEGVRERWRHWLAKQHLRPEELSWWRSLSRPKQLQYIKKHPQTSLRFASHWDDLSYEGQVRYLKVHPKSKRRITKQKGEKGQDFFLLDRTSFGWDVGQKAEFQGNAFNEKITDGQLVTDQQIRNEAERIVREAESEVYPEEKKLFDEYREDLIQHATGKIEETMENPEFGDVLSDIDTMGDKPAVEWDGPYGRHWETFNTEEEMQETLDKHYFDYLQQTIDHLNKLIAVRPDKQQKLQPKINEAQVKMKEIVQRRPELGDAPEQEQMMSLYEKGKLQPEDI